MKKMTQINVIVVLFGILFSGAIGLTIPGEETICLSCSRIEYVYNQGMQLFDFERAKALYLAKIGYIRNATEPFAQLFAKTPLPRDATKEFYRANQDLRGTQKVLDDFKQFNIGHAAEDCLSTQYFLNATSSCLSEYQEIPKLQIRCNSKYKYRSFDGTCNNLKNPLTGSILTPFSRLLDASYDDDVLEPRRSVTGAELPSAREILNKVFAEKPIRVKTKPGFVHNMGFLIYGQFAVHDMASQINALNDIKSNDGAIQCCSGDYKACLPDSLRHFACMPIDIPPNDKHYGPKNLRCHNFVRSQPAFQNDKRSSAAEQANRVTGYLDASIIYGKTEEEANKLRTFYKGKLQTSPNNVLPVKDGKTKSYYETGDFRVNQTPALACTHSILVRLHNRIAGTLSKMNSHWCDEKLYQEARRIVIAIHQHIIYSEYIPALINETIDCYGIDGTNYDYNEEIEGTAINDFSTGVFRFLHAYVPRHVETYGPDGNRKKAYQLSRIMDNTKMLERYFCDVVRGQVYQSINGWLYDDEVRNQLFNQSDLISVDIQRGRDHGIPPYYRYREICNLPPVKSFDDLYPLISYENINNLRKVYKSVYDIDLIVGGGLEEKNGLLMGPTFNCITKIQFSRLKLGDRFFYTNRNYFTAAQLNEIRKFTFAKLLAITTSIDEVPLHGFYIPSLANPLIQTEILRDFDLSPWMD